MARVAIAYGPPGAKGVSAIMGIGADDVEPHPAPAMLKKAAWLGVALWGIGVVMNRPALRGAGLGAAAVGFGVKHLVEKDLSTPPAALITK